MFLNAVSASYSLFLIDLALVTALNTSSRPSLGPVAQGKPSWTPLVTSLHPSKESFPDTLWVHLASRIVSNSSFTKTIAPWHGCENDTRESIKIPIKVRMYDTTVSLLFCPVILSWNRIGLVWRNLFLTNPCWLLHDSFCYTKSCCTVGDPKSGSYFMNQSPKQGWKEAFGDSTCTLTSTFRHFVTNSLA